MPKTKISEYSATANSNTDVASINIDEGCAPSGINNAIRAVMGHLKDFQAGTNSDSFNGPVGTTTAAAVAATTLTTSSTVTHNGGTANGVAYLNGSKVLTTGSALVFDGSNLGLGVTPSAWQSTRRALQVGTNAALWGQASGSGATFLSNNTFFDGSAFKYLTTSAASYYVQLADGSHTWNTSPSGTAGTSATFTQAMTLDASGNLGVGVTSPSGKLHVRPATNVNHVLGYSSTSATYDCYNDAVSAYLNLKWNGGAMTLDSSGNLLVGTTTAFNANDNGFNLLPGTGSALVTKHLLGTASGQYYALYTYNGGFIGSISQAGTTGVLFNVTSDYRLKDIDGPVTNSGAFIDKLNPVQGSWKSDGARFIGFLAHELQEASETVVGTGVKDGEEMQSIDYSNAELIANLVAELKSLRQRVASLEA